MVPNRQYSVSPQLRLRRNSCPDVHEVSHPVKVRSDRLTGCRLILPIPFTMLYLCLQILRVELVGSPKMFSELLPVIKALPLASLHWTCELSTCGIPLPSCKIHRTGSPAYNKVLGTPLDEISVFIIRDPAIECNSDPLERF